MEVEREDASGREALGDAPRPTRPAGRRLWVLTGVVAASAVLVLGVLGWMHAASPGPDERPPARGLAAPRDGARGTAGQGAGDARDRGGASTVPGRAATTARRLRLLVPAYIYPDRDGRKQWRCLMDAGAKVDLTVIVNP